MSTTRTPHDETQSDSTPEILDYADSPPEIIKRPFTRATGFVFQSVGFLLTISTCCIWPAAYWWQSSQPFAGMLPPWQGAATGTTPTWAMPEYWGMLGTVASFLGGMLLLVVGLGLQHDRMRTGRTAMAVTAIPALFFIVYLGMCLWRFPAPTRIFIVAAMAVLWIVLFVLAGVSADELRKIPPTPSERGWTSIDEDDLRTISSHRSRDRTNP